MSFDIQVKQEINWLTGEKKFPSIYRKQITRLQSGSQSDMELRNRTVWLLQQGQQSSCRDDPNPKFSEPRQMLPGM